jgi:adenine-specific DNA-methyltransferase
MSDRSDQRETIIASLKAFDSQPLAEPARKLFATLGYQSDRRLPIATPAQFRAQLDPTNKLTDREREALDGLQSIHLLFQLSDAELTAHGDLFDDPSAVQTTKIESYLFFAADLPSGQYTRTALSTLVRAINKPLPMPALVLFRHGDSISIGIIHRRLHKRDQSKDVLDKVTLIKDIACADPIRAHVEILNDFVLANLDHEFGVSNFVRLHEAWQKRLAAYALSNDFYREIADWYFWAHHQVDNGAIRLPQHCDTEQEKSLFLIRLLTRVIFCWFLVEKRLIPTDLFRERCLKSLLKEFNPSKDPTKPDTAPTYYRTILQNLFFGTLNMPPEQRTFREKRKPGEKYDQNYGITNLWRYETSFRNTADWLELAKRIPFLNGGLFDCLDDKTGKKKDNFILDGFSDRADFGCHLPNDLFFGAERTADLSKDYGEEDKRTARSKKAKVRGLIEILSRYKFTIEENTPLEEEIALDPELLGKVFENLLASYNEDTRTTARKALGAFYTPREIVSYMVDEALKSYLTTQVPRCKSALEDLFSNKATLKEIKPDTRDALIAAIGRVKILDPACGSGAFPMGALHRLVDLLQKLDPNNESWKRDRLAEARRYRAMLENAGAQTEEIKACDARIADIEKSFDSRFHALDFARKLYLIENSIYGVDIQPVATQIAKLRFFISLVVDQKVNMKAVNLGVRPLPNLETRIVAADTLMPIEKTEIDLFSGEIDKLRAELAAIRHEHFNARRPADKRKWRDADAEKRQEIGALLEREHAIPKKAARQLASWDPYDQNAFAHFFDSEWMFGLPVGKVRIQGKVPSTLLGNFTFINDADGQSELTPTVPHEFESGFDIVIGNPPYVMLQAVGLTGEQLDDWRIRYVSARYKVDLYQVFFEASVRLLRPGGVLGFITPNSFLKNKFSASLRTFLLSEAQPIAFLLFYYQVFPGQSVDNAVTILRKREHPDIKALGPIRSAVIATNEDLLAPLRWRITPPARIVAPSYELELDVDENAAELLNRIDSSSEPLGAFCGAYFGIQTFDRDSFVALTARTKRFQPVIVGTNVKRWTFTSPTEFVDFRPEAIKSGGDPEIYARNRIVVRQIGVYPEGCICPVNMLTLNTIYNIYEKNPNGQLPFYLSILNSSVVRFYWRLRFFDNKETFPKIKKAPLLALPVPIATEKQRKLLEQLVGYLSCVSSLLGSTKDDHQNTRDPLMLAYFEQILNGLAFELYFPEELHGAGLQLFDLVEQTRLPDINAIPEPDRLPRLRLLFESLYDGAHHLRIALAKLQTLDTVRIIEGKA